MPYTLTREYAHAMSNHATTEYVRCDCRSARRGCAPSYVFSVSGQVGFRSALVHVRTCHTRLCRHLQTAMTRGIAWKLRSLFIHDVLLGCVHLQPILYGSRRVIFSRKRFPIVARHLANCQKESCAQLRRAVLLTIRSLVNPNASPVL